jgi:hypothetical protein
VSAVKVFISYARRDAPVAQRLYYDLKRAGAKPWLDSVDLLPGQQWGPAIRRAIRESDCFIALLSAHAVSDRRFFHSELNDALHVLEELPQNQLFLIPARIDECSPPHERLRDLHWVDLFPSYDQGLTKLFAALSSIDNSEYNPALAVLDVFGIKWIGGGAFATVEEETLSLATILKNPTPSEIVSFWGTACAVKFGAEVSSCVPWATIDEVFIVVNSYQTLPRYEAAYPKPFEEAHVYYIEMDDPQLSGNNRFLAEYSFRANQQNRWGVVRLESGKPEWFVVRLNARTPGVYQFDVRVSASHKDRKQELTVVADATFLFK